MLASQPAVAAAEREPRDAGVGHHAAGRGQAVLLGRLVDVRPERAAADLGDLALGVDLHAVHRGEVDQHPAVDRGQARYRMPAAAHRDTQVLLLARA